MSPEELGRLLDEHGAALTLYARQWSAAPEDIVQEAFLKLVSRRDPPENPAAWLFRVVRNAAVSAARRHERRRRHEAAVAARPWFAQAEGAALDERTATEAVRSLPDEQRESIIAHLWGGLSFAEVAVLMGTSRSAAHRNYAAGLAALRERLGVSCPMK